MKNIFITLFLLLVSCFLNPVSALAQVYGDGVYGGGIYNQGGSSSSPAGASAQAGGPSVCTAGKPGSTPDLFQITTTSTTATLFFVPAKEPLTGYQISFGTNLNKLEYGTSFNSKYYPGVQKVTINLLKPSTKYYFKIAAVNDCMTGSWSKALLTRTTSGGKRTYYSSSQKVPEVMITGSTTTKTSKKATPTPEETSINAPKATITPVPTITRANTSSKPTANPFTTVWTQISNFFKSLKK